MSGGGIKIEAIQLLCPDPEKTAHFYERAHGFAQCRCKNGIALDLGQQRVELIATSARPLGPSPANATAFQHFAVVVSDMKAAFTQLREVWGWSAISRAGPERLPVASGGVIAFKFRDPDGHPLEYIQFPAGAVPLSWRGFKGLFLGIDHTAITVADTKRSIAFYHQFGFTPVSRSLNEGAEQAQLDALDTPVVQVTGLCPPGGAPPHLELLCYRAPATLLTLISDDDVLATRTVLSDMPEAEQTRAKPVTHMDPDGHRLVIFSG